MREIKFRPCKVTVSGVEVWCVNKEIAEEFVKRLVSEDKATIKNMWFCFSVEQAINSFNTVYDSIKDRK